MARDPNKYREVEDLNEADDEEEDEEFEGRPEQSGDEDNSIGMEDESAQPVRTGRRGAQGRSR